ncbi:ribosomal-protein-alanine acetyltransferase [Geomonas silvestris]|uniref:[Ribosomal protein bS18]-alanine N-acetyltransferase n=1 Tax=Geomonas silvestris TaxID=2740184 RepID=A0A6V8MN86_9BACT|nr:ribosomal protein S18-alanine N-acetyltransferase [Geomonas silvestris]GFO61431.1 ribosomal-protein-alanine acetyltransferase [Geomonas silvestris]
MSENDLDAVLEIESASFARPWTRDHFRDEIQSPFGIPLVALIPEGHLAGYLCLKVILDEAEILDVAVDPAQRGRGIGRLLVWHAFELCRERQVLRLGLEVRTGNREAITLYGSVGFHEVGCRKAYYENGDDAILMEYTFEQQAEESDAV